MLIAERDNLIAVKTMIYTPAVHLILFENKEGNLFLSSNCKKPEGTVYYATTPSLFCLFLEGQVNLQTLFNNSPSHFVEITTKEKSAVYNRRHTEIEINEGDKTIKQLTDKCPIEIW
jgi:hypothetical protein